MVVLHLQEQEARLPSLLKMMVWAQQQLNEKLLYPRIDNLITATLSEPADA